MKYLVLKVSLKAGLGDSIFSLIQGIAYAKLSGRTLAVDWRGGTYGLPKDENLFGRLFELKNVPYSPTVPSEGTVYPPIWLGEIDSTFNELKARAKIKHQNRKQSLSHHFAIDVSKFDYEHDVLVMWDFSQFRKVLKLFKERQWIPETKYNSQSAGHIFNQFVEVKEDTRTYIDDLWDKLSGDRTGSKIIGVHIRETKESFNMFGPIKRNTYLESVQSILKKDPEVKKIFLATDNEHAQKEFVSRFEDKVILKDKWFGSPWDPIHQSLESCPDRWLNLRDALFDMIALSRCDYLVRRR